MEREEGRLFAICNLHLSSESMVVLACNSAGVNVPLNALTRLSIMRSHTKRNVQCHGISRSVFAPGRGFNFLAATYGFPHCLLSSLTRRRICTYTCAITGRQVCSWGNMNKALYDSIGTGYSTGTRRATLRDCEIIRHRLPGCLRQCADWQ